MANLVGWKRSITEEGNERYGDLYPRNLAAMMKVEELGNWKAVSTFIDKLPVHIRLSVVGVMVLYANKYQRKLKTHIRQNGAQLGWAPLGEKYRRNKKMHRGSIYQYSEALYKNIIVASFPTAGRVYVTVNHDASVQSYNGLTVSQTAHVLESGSIRGKYSIPPRPLFKPTWRLMGGNAALAAVTREALSMVLKKEINNAR